ncbi:major capsid protein [Microvirus sp.]|nr:major capsid protein [Microvirus sp.]
MTDMIKKNIGKNTIGDNNKMSVSMRKYQRSTHDLSYAWRNTQTIGTLVPFMCEVGLPGDTWEINTEASVLTHPTVGPLFGSFKLQGEYYVCPIRLYNGLLHNNALGIGLKMSQVKLPKIEVSLKGEYDAAAPSKGEFKQINPSCLLSYLGLKGYANLTSSQQQGTVKKNITAGLAYWDIFKNYHANKQETYAYQIAKSANVIKVDIAGEIKNIGPEGYVYERIVDGDIIKIEFQNEGTKNPDAKAISIRLKTATGNIDVSIEDISDSHTTTKTIIQFTAANIPTNAYMIKITYNKINLQRFLLENLDKMREDILKNTGANKEFIIDQTEPLEPYATWTSRIGNQLKTSTPLCGLAVKTYQSDIFNNWINTEWLDGEGGINEITAIDVSSGSFTMDTLNLAKKVYDMLNRIAVSGGTYQDWIQTVYTNDYIERSETPIYEGGFSSEIIFQEVISNSATANEPLGTLAGRGQNAGLKGGTVKIKIDEPSYIIGLVSITPRIDYSQGNRFDVDLDTLDDLHKPALDAIGFQDLTTNKMAWWDAKLTENNTVELKTVGKQPAWLDYMTNYNKVFGNFAIPDNEMFMTLNRKYEINNNLTIEDLTTYIDPEKYNYIFADTSLDAMNFWVQLGIGAKVRRKMSAKVIPNL